MEPNVYFVSSEEYFQMTKIRFTKIKEVTNYDQTNYDKDITQRYDKKSDIILVEKPEQSTIFCFPSNMNYIYVTSRLDGGSLYIIDFKNIGFTEDLRTQVLNTPPPRYEVLMEIKAQYIYVPSLFNVQKIPIPPEVQAEVSQLNERIAGSGCTGYRLAFDYGYNFPGENIRLNSYYDTPCVLMLCLFHGNTCVSSIEIHPSNDQVTINSFSNPKVEGVGLNKLLRAAAILILPKLNPSIRLLESNARSPISAHILINKLNGNSQNEAIERPVPFDTLERMISEKGRIDIVVEITDPVTIQHAQRLFDEVLQSPTFQEKCNGEVEDEGEVGGKAKGRRARRSRSRKFRRSKKQRRFKNKTQKKSKRKSKK
jgi:hypothetical protein